MKIRHVFLYSMVSIILGVSLSVKTILMDTAKKLEEIYVYKSDHRPNKYVKITVYNPVKAQTQGNPLETANGEIINVDSIGNTAAISRDLEQQFPMGSHVLLQCDCPYDMNMYRINDKLGPDAINQIDILELKTKVGLYYGKITNIPVHR